MPLAPTVPCLCSAADGWLLQLSALGRSQGETSCKQYEYYQHYRTVGPDRKGRRSLPGGWLLLLG